MKASVTQGPPKRFARQATTRGICNATRRRTNLRVVAFKEQDDIKDWRVKQMVDTCHVYYASIWGRGDLTVADTILDPKFVYRDLCSVASWAQQQQPEYSPLSATGMVVGPRAFKSLVYDTRMQYPDYHIEVDELAVSDTHRIFVNWVSQGTQLEAVPGGEAAAAATPREPDRRHWFHPQQQPGAVTGPGGPPAANTAPSYHNSLVHGVDVITFNHDRSRMLEVNVYRQLSSDERRAVERRLAPNPLEIRLARLHWEQPQQQQQQQKQQQKQVQQKQQPQQPQSGARPPPPPPPRR